MREFKIRYGYSDGTNWIIRIFTIEEVENGWPFEVLNDEPLLKKYKLVVRDLFTGLYDKNGKEIYEGDILSVTDPYNNNESYNGAEVIFSKEYVGGWVLHHKDANENLNIGTREKFVRIIGNIHENANLLENK